MVLTRLRPVIQLGYTQLEQRQQYYW